MMNFNRRKFITTALISGLTVACTQNNKNTQNTQIEKSSQTSIPNRVVALEWGYVENLLALGIQPVGVADITGYKKFVNIDLKLDNSVVDIGTRSEPNLETITQLKPDLILGIELRHQSIYPTLSAIAPTFLSNPYPDSGSQFQEMERTFLEMATKLNQQENGKLILKEMYKNIENAKAKITNSQLQNQPFTLAQLSDNSPQIRLFTDNSLAVEICNQIGLKNAWEGNFDQFGFNTVGVEALTKIENANFLYISSPENIYLKQLQNNPVWQNLKFVKEKRTYPLKPNTWVFGGPLSMQVLVKEIISLLPEN
ncbi:MAG: iron-siderophore ABC transporter substrate-binding protein [Nostocales cyanobacterium]|nr:MAG: iron-siderophore ABC transporter substrate-binding protein [Nostocales cyanobacterium]TAF13387.1 MAG: iron-siderophore ABC transporter substrate-binding protein [Nostocales cyanobacterium]